MGTIVVCHYSLSGNRVKRGIRVLVNLRMRLRCCSCYPNILKVVHAAIISSGVITILWVYLFIIFFDVRKNNKLYFWAMMCFQHVRTTGQTYYNA